MLRTRPLEVAATQRKKFEVLNNNSAFFRNRSLSEGTYPWKVKRVLRHVFTHQSSYCTLCSVLQLSEPLLGHFSLPSICSHRKYTTTAVATRKRQIWALSTASDWTTRNDVLHPFSSHTEWKPSLNSQPMQSALLSPRPKAYLYWDIAYSCYISNTHQPITQTLSASRKASIPSTVFTSALFLNVLRGSSLSVFEQ